MPNPTPSIVERLRKEAAELHVQADRLEEHGWPTSAEPTRLQARTPEEAANLIEEQQRQLERVGEAVEAALAELSKGKWGKAFAILETDEVRAALHNDKGGEGA